jgi:hypothetical protein
MGNLDPEVDRLTLRKSSASEHLSQAFALEQLRNHKGLFGVLPDIMNGQDVGVTQRGDRARLLFETPQSFRVRRERRRHYLDGDIAAQALVACLVHLAHAACADEFENFIRA